MTKVSNSGTARVVVVGAGAGGLAAAVRLAANGVPVSVLEKAPTPGGKMRQLSAGGATMDAGPTVFTLRGVFDELFEYAGASLDSAVKLRPANVLARHVWSGGAQLDLHADRQASVDAIGAFAGAAEAHRYAGFCDSARAAFEGLEATFMQAQQPSMLEFARRVGPGGLAQLAHASPLRTLWGALGRHFRDPRLRQLFGRYSTYCGSSPFEAPATLLLIAHAELASVWTIDGGMHRLAVALADLARARGADIHYGSPVAQVLVTSGRASGVELATGERIDASAVIVNADVGAVASGLFGPAVTQAVSSVGLKQRSLSAVTWCLHAEARGFPLARHSVFFSDDYHAEFTELRKEMRLPSDPTVYVCAQDRDDTGGRSPDAPSNADGDTRERLLCLVNAPPTGDYLPHDNPVTDENLDACETHTFARLAQSGLELSNMTLQRTTPMDFERLFPGTGGALYGRASHGPLASFRRQGARTKVPGLYMAGGSTHPSAGVPMAATAGRLAVEALLSDRSTQMQRSKVPA